MPRLISPLAGDRVPHTLELRWSAVPDAAGYAIQVAESEDFSGPLLVETTAGAPGFSMAATVFGPLWWRVRAFDSAGRSGRWSAVRKLEIIAPPMAAAVAAVTLTPSRVAGGESAEGLITLEDPAPGGGATVQLASSDPSKARLPSRILFPAGSKVATFSVATVPVNDDATVRILADARRERRAATLAIASPRPRARLASLAVNPAILAAGGSAQGTVTLAGRAPRRATVRLHNSDPAHASLPDSVTISAGASAANFSIQTAHDVTPAEIVVTATLEDDVRSASLRLKGAGTMEMLPAPSLLAPAEGAAAVYNGSIEFSWSDVMGTASYTIEVYAPGGATPVVASRTVPASRLTITPLPAGVALWRVRANDAYGAPGQWSLTRSLRVTRR